MPKPTLPSNVRAWRVTFWLSTLLMPLLVASLAPPLTSSTELVWMRNALLYKPTPADGDRAPSTLPEGWLAERSSPAPMFGGITETNGLAAPGGDWETTLRIDQHSVPLPLLLAATSVMRLQALRRRAEPSRVAS